MKLDSKEWSSILKQISLIVLVGVLLTMPMLFLRAPKEVKAYNSLVLSQPTPGNGSVVSNSSGQIKVKFEGDPTAKVLLTNVVLKVDDKIVSHSMNYDLKTVYDSCGEPYEETTYASGWIVGPAVDSGTHNVQVTVSDTLGNTAALDWTFSVDAFEITTFPSNGTRVGGLNPTITLKAQNLYARDTDTLTATMRVNGTNTPVSIERVDNEHWTVTAKVYNLTNEVAAKVTGSVSNNRGVSKTYSFEFTPTISPPYVWPLYVIEGKTYTELTPDYNERLIRVAWTDPDGVDESSVIMTVDQKIVPTTIKSNVIYGPELKNGTHTVNVRLKDKLGNEANKTYTIGFKVPPMLTGSAKLYTSVQPLLSFVFDVMGSGLDPNKTILKVNGQQYPVNINGGTVVSQMPKMQNETVNTIALTVVDNEGLSCTHNLKFGISSFGEMPITNDGCAGCHNTRYFSTYDKWAHTRGPDIESSKLSTESCGHCHGVADQPQNYCTYCHDVVDLNWGHTNPNYVNKTSPIPPELATKITGTNCLICHTTLNRVPKTWWPGAFSVPLGIDYPYDPAEQTEYPYKHLIYTPHNTVYDSANENCKDCHSSNLTRAHNKKLKATGINMTCGTCHMSQDPEVKAAIVEGNTTCSACHDSSEQGHDSLHQSPIDATNCTTECHKTTLTQDHLTRTDNSGNLFTCDTCHASADNKVARTIAAGSLNCEGCHSQGHNIKLIDRVPADIPLFEGVLWTTPIEAEIFSGDSGVPANYDNGQAVFSSRKAISLSEIWSFYNDGLTAQGWQLKSGLPASGAATFTAEFVKINRAITVKCYNTANRDGSGQLLSGYRIEIWYR